MINLSIPHGDMSLHPRITVVGVGGAGGNAVNNMIRANLEGVEFVVANTDAQALAGSTAEKRLQLGRGITQGLGAGSRPDVGRAAAEEAMEQIVSYLDGSHMVFITAGMGGGTGTGAAPVIARAAREQGILTVGVVTKPFHFEGAHRMRLAEQGLQELQQYVDTLIIIPNQNLFRIANEKTTFADAFKLADEVLHSGVRGVTDLMVQPGLINLDFADIRTVMAEMGKAMMGTGEAEGERRSLNAAEAAISNPLLDDVSMKGAKGVLINITGGLDMTLYEVDEATNRIRDEVDPDANIIFGSTFDESMQGKVRVSVVATGIDLEAQAVPRPTTYAQLTVVSDRARSQTVAPAPRAAMTVTSRPLDPPRPVVVPAAAAAAAAVAMPVEEPAVDPMVAFAAAMPEPEPVAVQPEPVVRPLPAVEPVRAVPEPAPRPSFTQPAAAFAPQPMVATAAQRPVAPAFVPPRPVQAPARPAMAAPPRLPEPHAEPERAVAPASGEPARKRPGLFRRVTGLLREEEEQQHHQDLRPAAPALRQDPPRPLAAPAQPRPAAQHTLPIEPSRAPLPRNDDDALDIPAFLRRQAN